MQVLSDVHFLLKQIVEFADLLALFFLRCLDGLFSNYCSVATNLTELSFLAGTTRSLHNLFDREHRLRVVHDQLS